jgi:hypothetical protein
MAPLIELVDDIVVVRSEEQVRGIDAWWIVAVMEDVCAFGNIAEGKLPR